MDNQLLFNAHSHSVSTQYRTIYQLPLVQNQLKPALFSVGIHPENANIDSTPKKEYFKNIVSKNCVAIGEIGLDTRITIPMETQENMYIKQLELAKTTDLPILLHCVNAWDRCRFLHSTHAPEQVLIYHGFSKASIINQVLAYDQAIISIGASILTNTALQTVVTAIPLERLLLETDDAIVDFLDIYTKVAELKSISLPTLIEAIHTNANRIFKL
jgi:TatD DNase family protein